MIKKSICKHYKRNCDKKAPCCQIYYPCRLCHDDNYKGPKSEGCKTETMDRYNVKEIRCRECLTEQAPSQECTNCKIQFARYYCDVCKLYDDTPNKQIYHCDKCKMCRIGTQEDNFHCDVCDVCLSLKIKKDHKCTQKAFEQNCAVCQEYLKNSTKFVQQLNNCGHFIHIDCLTKSAKKGLRNCPICNIAIYKMEQEEIEYYDEIATQLREEFDEETKNKVVNIICMDCQGKSEGVPFNVYVKCQKCGSYNTRK